jgi:hypothetical protein
MRKVVDTNFLKSPKLTEYLREPSNVAAVPDYVFMETLAGGDVTSTAQSLAILAKYPSQVIVLKTTSAACKLKTRKRSRGLQRRLIDRSQTAGFPAFCKKLDAARGGDKQAEKEILATKRDAAAQLELLIADMETYAANMHEAAKGYTPAELKIIRSGQAWTQELHDKLVDNVFDLALKMFESCNVKELPPAIKLSNSLIFRYAICAHILSLSWIAVGGPPSKTDHAKIRNDAIDANLAAFATYFDDFLTEDTKAADLHKNAKFLVKQFQMKAGAGLPSASDQ